MSLLMKLLFTINLSVPQNNFVHANLINPPSKTTYGVKSFGLEALYAIIFSCDVSFYELCLGGALNGFDDSLLLLAPNMFLDAVCLLLCWFFKGLLPRDVSSPYGSWKS